MEETENCHKRMVVCIDGYKCLSVDNINSFQEVLKLYTKRTSCEYVTKMCLNTLSLFVY